jgi:predicted transposase/invertase (TIGR01784 family)
VLEFNSYICILEFLHYIHFMVKIHDTWYKTLFSNPRIVKDLLTSFVEEQFVFGLDFSSIKKLNSSFVSEEFKKRESDVIYEIKSRGVSNYIYVLIEFQSTVDPYMALRMASYVFLFHQEIVKTTECRKLQPVFPILLYNGSESWTSPESFRDLLAPSDIPMKYLPEFRYYKIAINEIPKRHLVELRNAAAAVFYVENSTPEEINNNYQELIALLKDIFKNEGAMIVNSIVQWMRSAHKIHQKPKPIRSIQDLMEVSTMWEEAVKKHEEALIEKGIEKGIVIERQKILIDQLTAKFGQSKAAEKKIKAVSDANKLENALRKILFAKNRDEVMEYLE